MSACRRTDALEQRLARGGSPSATEIEHATGCRPCAATLAAAARLEAQLPSTLRAMVDEPLPPPAELLSTSERGAPWRGMALLASVVSAAAAAVVVGLAILAGQFIGVTGPAPGGGGTPSAPTSVEGTGSVPDDMAGWVAEADASIWAHLDRPLPAPELRLVRLERCGDSALAFFADPDPSAVGPLLFGIGSYREPPFEAGFGGVASSVDEPEAANARSQQAKPCEIEVDTTLASDIALAAYVTFLHGDDRVTDARVLATKLVTDETALAYVDEIETDGGLPHQQVLVLRRETGSWVVTGAQGGDLPVVGSAVGVTPLGVAKAMPDERWAAVGRTDDERVVAVELDFAGFTHRYPITDGAFVIALPPEVGFELPYRLLDADGAVVSAGTSQP